MNLIAEFCQNHLGKLDILKEMVLEAKKNGATHAKIQGLYSDEITKRKEFEDPNGILYRPYVAEVERLRKLDLDFDTESWFVDYCKLNQIIPMITVFTHKGLERAKRAGFKSIKIASYDCASFPIIRKTLDFADEIVISTGATYWSEIHQTAKMLSEIRDLKQKIAFLHARTIYPTNLADFGISKMSVLAAFGFAVGLSDHTKPTESGLVASKIAILLGADYVERHFTVLDRSETKDGPVSITPSELKELRDFSNLTKLEQLNSLNLNDLEKAIPLNSLEPSAAEIVNRSYYRGRVASTYDGKYVYSWEEL